jgi:hypothetical protein
MRSPLDDATTRDPASSVAGCRCSAVAEYLAFVASDRAHSMTGAIANLSTGALVD